MVTAADTWDVRIPTGAQIRRLNPSVQSDPASGYARGRHLTYQEPRIWEIRWPEATADDYKQLRELFENTHGGALALTFSPPEGGSSITAFIVPDSFQYSLTGVGQYTLRCQVRGDPA
jgi:hypothetical protein